MKITSYPGFSPPARLAPLTYLLLPSLPLVFLAHRLAFLPPGYLNVEFLLIGMVGVFLPRTVTFVLLFLDSFADFALCICKTYQLTLDDVFTSLGSINAMPTYRVPLFILTLLLVILVCAATVLVQPRRPERHWTAGSLLVVFVVASLAGILAGQRPFGNGYVSDSYRRIVRCPAFSLAKMEVFYHRVKLESRYPNTSALASASFTLSAILHQPNAGQPPDVVLVLVESWGLPLDAHLAQTLTAPYDDPGIASKYYVTYGSVPFSGGTVPAEARELCHSKIAFGLLRATAQRLGSCLPALFHQRGYINLSIHGYTGRMFQRSIWYRTIGFDQSWFGPDLDLLKLSKCGGAFPGTCDTAIASWIGSSILSVKHDKPRFIYWVTLNSHLPVPAHPNLPDNDVCATQPALQKSTALCSWFRLISAVHQSVQQLALSSTTRPTLFVLVGDHAPPFADSQLRQEFSATNVPYVILTPTASSLR
jgi:hypothetical protein